MTDNCDLAPATPFTGAALPLKDTLRTIRFAVKRGRMVLGRPPVRLPSPVRSTADAILADFDQIAGRVNGMVADISHAVLDAGAVPAWAGVRLADVLASHRPDAAFARVAYRALNDLLAALGAEEALVSEVRAADAFHAARDAGAPAAVAGALAAELTRLHAVQDVVLPPDAAATAAEISAMAAFALALLLVSERAGGEADAADLCLAALDVTRALSADVAAAAHDRAALAALIATYADKL